MRSLFEKYRPGTWENVIGHKHVKIAISRMKDRGDLGGRGFWITGPSGVGKTTLGYLIAGDICDPENFIELDAGEITPAKLADLERNLRYTAIGEKPGRAVLINESHGLRQDSIRKLLVMLERIPNHCCWIFTTTTVAMQLFDGIDASPLLSRCIEFRLEGKRYIESFAQRAKEIAETEGLGGASLPEYVDLVKRCESNLRRTLCEIEAGLMVRDFEDAEMSTFAVVA